MNKLSTNKRVTLHAYKLGFEVTEDGRCWKPDGTEVKLKVVNKRRRYPAYSIRVPWRKKSIPFLWHKLAAYCFYGNRFLNSRLLVCHRNGNKDDLSKKNLYLGTHWDNENDDRPFKRVRSLLVQLRRRKLLGYEGLRPKNAKLTDDDVRKIRRMLAKGHTQTEIADYFEVCVATVNLIHHRKCYRDVV